jgi:hypothetical protein
MPCGKDRLQGFFEEPVFFRNTNRFGSLSLTEKLKLRDYLASVSSSENHASMLFLRRLKVATRFG